MTRERIYFDGRRDRREKRSVGESRIQLAGIVGKKKRKKCDFRWYWLQLSLRYVGTGISLFPGKGKVREVSDSP